MAKLSDTFLVLRIGTVKVEFECLEQAEIPSWLATEWTFIIWLVLQPFSSPALRRCSIMLREVSFRCFLCSDGDTLE